MAGPKADLILHPIRFRILTAISSYHMAAKEIAEVMPDIPQTTLYRHINALVEGGLLKIVGEKQIRGTIERTFALTSPPSLTAEDLRGMSRQEGEQAFTMFLSSLMSDARAYLNHKPENAEISPLEDGVQISKVQLFLDEVEFQEMSSKILELMLKAAQNQPREGRRRRMFSCVFMPVGD
jgi:DNA-binding transcriptional ArsR family regulator